MKKKFFTNKWFEASGAKRNWDALFPRMRPTRMLEIGSFEGRSAVYAIEAGPLEEVWCVDTWEGGLEHDDIDMASVEKRFDLNIYNALSAAEPNVKVYKRKGRSSDELIKLLADGKKNYFDFVYIDGSHQAPDVLTDAILAFQLCRINGVIGFDDYAWVEKTNAQRNALCCPKMAIDAFSNIYFDKVEMIMGIPLYQIYFQKKAS